MDQPKIERMLRLMQYLTGNCNYTIDELMDKLDLSKRTFYRYIDTFKSAGFAVIRIAEGVYRMAYKRNNNVDLSKIVYFSEEEAYVVSNLIDGLDNTNAMKQGLKTKLVAVYDATNLGKYSLNKGNSKVIAGLTYSIKQKKKVLLHNYSSSNSKMVKQYQVEPYSFTTNYVDVWAFDINDMKNKTFKVERIGEVEVLDNEGWEFEPKHKEEPIDSFRSHSNEKFHVKLKMSQVAKNQLVEDYPLANRELSKGKEGEWYYEGDVRSMKGVGRFVMKLPEEICILEGDELKEFVRSQAKYILENM